MAYYYVRNGKQLGPYSEEQMRGMLAGGEIREDDLGWRDGLGAWEPIKSLILPAYVVPPPALPKATRFASTSPEGDKLGTGTKVLIGLGALGFLLIATLLGVVLFQLFKVRATAQVYVDDYIAHIAPAWSSDELLRRVTPEYRAQFPPAAMRDLFHRLAPMGNFKHAEPGTALVMENTIRSQRRTIAQVQEKAEFEHGTAIFNIYLVREEGQWTIGGFHVNYSPLHP